MLVIQHLLNLDVSALDVCSSDLFLIFFFFFFGRPALMQNLNAESKGLWLLDLYWPFDTDQNIQALFAG